MRISREDENLNGCTPPKLNIDTKNDGLENVPPLKYGYLGHLPVKFRGSSFFHGEKCRIWDWSLELSGVAFLAWAWKGHMASCWSVLSARFTWQRSEKSNKSSISKRILNIFWTIPTPRASSPWVSVLHFEPHIATKQTPAWGLFEQRSKYSKEWDSKLAKEWTLGRSARISAEASPSQQCMH